MITKNAIDKFIKEEYNLINEDLFSDLSKALNTFVKASQIKVWDNDKKEYTDKQLFVAYKELKRTYLSIEKDKKMIEMFSKGLDKSGESVYKEYCDKLNDLVKKVEDITGYGQQRQNQTQNQTQNQQQSQTQQQPQNPNESKFSFHGKTLLKEWTDFFHGTEVWVEKMHKFRNLCSRFLQKFNKDEKDAFQKEVHDTTESFYQQMKKAYDNCNMNDISSDYSSQENLGNFSPKNENDIDNLYDKCYSFAEVGAQFRIDNTHTFFISRDEKGYVIKSPDFENDVWEDANLEQALKKFVMEYRSKFPYKYKDIGTYTFKDKPNEDDFKNECKKYKEIGCKFYIYGNAYILKKDENEYIIVDKKNNDIKDVKNRIAPTSDIDKLLGGFIDYIKEQNKTNSNNTNNTNNNTNTKSEMMLLVQELRNLVAVLNKQQKKTSKKKSTTTKKATK